MEGPETYKSTIVNGKILDFAKRILSGRMKKRQSDIEDKIAVLIKENEYHARWFSDIINKKPKFSKGVMTYEDIMKTKDKKDLSLSQFLDEEIREAYKNQIREEFRGQVEDLTHKKNSDVAKENLELKDEIAKLKEREEEREGERERERERERDREREAALQEAERALQEVAEKEIALQEAAEREREEIIKLKEAALKEAALKEAALKEAALKEAALKEAALKEALTKLNEAIEKQSDENENLKQHLIKQTEQLVTLNALNKLNEIKQGVNDKEAQQKIADAIADIKKEYAAETQKAQQDYDLAMAENKAKNYELTQQIVKLQERVLALTKELLLLKANEKLRKQQFHNYIHAPARVSTKIDFSSFVKKKSRVEDLKALMTGGAPGKKLYMTGGASESIEIEIDAGIQTLVVFNESGDVVKQYPLSGGPNITFFTDELMEKYIQKIKDLNEEIAKLNAIIPAPIIPAIIPAPTTTIAPTIAQPTIAPIATQPVSALCSFVQQATNKDSALCAFVKNSANPVPVPSMVRLQELVRELILTKTMNQQIVKNLLIESIANKTNQQIVTMFDNKTQTLETEKQTLAAEKQTLETEKQTLAAEKQTLETEKTQLETDNTSLTSQLATAATTALTTAVKQAQIKAKESLNKGFMDKYVSFSEESKV